MAALSEHQLLSLAGEHQRNRRLAEAEEIYRFLLRSHPANGGLLNAIGSIAFETGRLDEAEEILRQAIAADPMREDARNNLGSVFLERGRWQDAEAVFAEALRLNPRCAVVHYNLGNVHLRQYRWEEAVACYRRALAEVPQYGPASLNLTQALIALGRMQEARAVSTAALAIFPGDVPLLNALGNACMQEGDPDEAAAAYLTALERAPEDALVTANLAHARMEQGRVEESVALFQKAVANAPAMAMTHSSLILALQHLPGTGAQIAAECERWWLRHGAEAACAYTNEPSPERRIRIGYISADFREHPVGHQVLPLVRDHDRAHFEVVCYSDVTGADSITAEFRAAATGWRETAALDPAALAELVRSDRIDILVDLAQHSAGNRLPVFSRKPAPVQVSFAGYPGRTGLKTVDWRLTDRFLDPAKDDSSGTERAWRLPDSFWCYEPPQDCPEVGALPASATGTVTFGCLNRFPKVNARVLAVWSRILHALPSARLVLICPAGESQRQLLAEFEALGIAPARIGCIARMTRADYFAAYSRLDLMLDAFPYNGHVTTCDALWMGVPVVSFAGKLPVSRGALSILSNAGLPELVADDEDGYVRTAVGLAQDLPRLASLRAELRERTCASALADTRRFTRGIEAAYRAMWREWCEKSGSAQRHAS